MLVLVGLTIFLMYAWGYVLKKICVKNNVPENNFILWKQNNKKIYQVVFFKLKILYRCALFLYYCTN